MKQTWILCIAALISAIFPSFGSAKPHRLRTQSTLPFTSSYSQWIDPANHFIDFFTVDNEEQARVIFIGSSAYSEDGQGQRPTVSEGMGYGLLLAYANNDQTTFDKFLRYILGTANAYGCSAYGKQICYASAPFMMPWIVNAKGMPFTFASSSGAPAYYSNGSATDADIQIAWAIYLASLRVAKNLWAPSLFSTVEGKMTYAEIFRQMGREIRLNDVDIQALRYVPGNQWGAAGLQVLYPGYLTPEAFLALDTLPPPDISSKCPDFPDHSPINSLRLIFKNNVSKTVSIDYLGGNGTVQLDSNFVPKPDVPNGYTVSALTTAEAVFSSDIANYANATIHATYYDESGAPVMTSKYGIEYQYSKWTVTDQGSSKESSFCQSTQGNSVFVCLTAPDISKIDYRFSDVLQNSFASIEAFQKNHKTGLMPNVLHYDGQHYDAWSESFAYDACRFPLWTADFINNNPTHPIALPLTASLNYLLGNSGVANFVKNGTLPSEGIDAITQTALGSWDHSSPALNAPVLAAANILKDTALYNALSQSVFTYDITKNQPSPMDPVGDSSPYFNAVMVLLARACMENKLTPP